MSQLKCTLKNEKLKQHKLTSAVSTSQAKPSTNPIRGVPKSDRSKTSTAPEKVSSAKNVEQCFKPSPRSSDASYNCDCALLTELNVPYKLTYAEALRQDIAIGGQCKQVIITNNPVNVPTSTKMYVLRSDSKYHDIKSPALLNRTRTSKKPHKCQAPVQKTVPRCGNVPKNNIKVLTSHQSSACSTEHMDTPTPDVSKRNKKSKYFKPKRKFKRKPSESASKGSQLKQDEHPAPSSSQELTKEIGKGEGEEMEKAAAGLTVVDKPATARTRATQTQTQSPVAEHKLEHIAPINTLQNMVGVSAYLKHDWLETYRSKWHCRKEARLQELNDVMRDVEQLTAKRCNAEKDFVELFKNIKLVDTDLIVFDDFPELIEEQEKSELPLLTMTQEAHIEAAVCGPPDHVLITKYNLSITRLDIQTLLAHNWLNDKIINFYMNLLMDRSEQKHASHGLPRVYAMNTFFLPHLLQSGYMGVRRWTTKVDIFSKDIIPVPVHVSGMHWCMAIINFREPSIKYYDSMNRPNTKVLTALKQYLREESLDKRQEPLDMSQFAIESVSNMPIQLNGSDCGVFCCMFAEYITRNKTITFSQKDMIYFRRKMILEIIGGKLFI